MGKRGIVAVFICMLVLSMALVGCGGNSEKSKEAFTGTWNVVELVQDGQPVSNDDLEALKALGMEIYVNLNEDGTAMLALFGEVLNGTWDAKSATEGTITFSESTSNLTIENSRLKFENKGSSMVFEKGAAKEPPAASSSAGSDSGDPASASSAS